MDISSDQSRHSSTKEKKLGGLQSIRARRLAIALLVVVIGAAYFSLTYKGVFFPPDEGATAYHFEKSAEGAIQHRDFYSVYGMAYYVLGKALFNLFGASLTVLRTFTLVVKLALAALIFLIGLRLARPAFAFLGALGFIIWWGDPFIATTSYLYPAQISQLLGLLSVLFVLMYLGNDRRVLVLLAGTAAGMSSLFKPNVGVFNLTALCLFFLLREMMLDLGEETVEPREGETSAGIPIGRIGVAVELGGAVGVGVMLYVLFAGFGFDAPSFVFSLFPFYLAIACFLAIGIRVLKGPMGDALIWNRQKDTIKAFLLLVAGFLSCQLLQVIYFARHGALRDFFGMLNTAADYYSGYSIPFWGGMNIVIACEIALLIALALPFVARATAGFDPKRKIPLALIVMLLTALVPLLWYMRQSTPLRHHFTMWSVPLGFLLFASMFIVWRESRRPGSRRPGSGQDGLDISSFSLIAIYASANLLDAFPKVDPGHFMMVMPPVFVLFAFFAERFHDLLKDYLGPELPGIGRAVAGASTGMLTLGIFLPSLFMMASFQFLILPSPDGGYRLHEGKLSLVPRYPADLDRAKGIAVHTFGDRHRPPLVEPKARYIFDVARRVSAITREGDKLFATTTSSLMIYFLADRDGISDSANCYVWQTAMGTTTSDRIGDFSDRELAQLIHTERPAAIIVEEGDIETQRFMANWPTAWNYAMSAYRLSEKVGPYQIFVPK